jgi:hypothetical protein
MTLGCGHCSCAECELEMMISEMYDLRNHTYLVPLT